MKNLRNPDSGSTGKARRRFFSRSTPWLIFAAVLVGVFLRFHQLYLQIPADDEWHSLGAAAHLSFLQIAADFGGADRCIPLTLFDKLTADTIGLSEFWLRLPPLLAGIALLLLPMLCFAGSRSLDRSTVVGFSWLLAISPLLIYFTRYARPYSISLFLTCLAATAFFIWWNSGRRFWIGLYTLAAPVAVYFHLSVAFFVLAPLALVPMDHFVTGRGRPFSQLLRWGSATGGALALLIIPPMLRAGVIDRLDAGWTPNSDTVAGAIQLMAGSRHGWAEIALCTLVALGAVRLWIRFPRPAIYLSALCVVQLMGVLVAGPPSLSAPIVFTRYLLPILPVLLLAAAAGVSELEEWLAGFRIPIPRGSLGIGLAGVLFWAGPLPAEDYHPNNWTNHGLFNYSYDSSDTRYGYFERTRPIRISGFYKSLSHRPESSLILEAPWHYEWHCNPFAHYQRVHRQPMMVGFVGQASRRRVGELPLTDGRFPFASFAHLGDLDSIRARGVDYIILHKNLGAEIPGGCAPIDISHWISRYRSRVGPPVFEDDQLVVFRPSTFASSWSRFEE